jgi:glutamate--cysteine ligase
LLLYCLLSDSPAIGTRELEVINARSLVVARSGRQPGIELPTVEGSLPLHAAAAPLREPMLELAAYLDHDGHAYRDSVAAQWAAIDESALTPSARLLEGMRASGASFEEYALEVGRRHHDYFVGAPLEAAVEAEFERLADASLRLQAEREAADSLNFDEYLADFVRRI